LRAFLAIPVQPPALDDAVHLLGRLRAGFSDVRWVRDEGLHVTLHFFASLHENDVSRVTGATRDAIAQAVVEPFTVRLGSLGVFPREGDERVLWIGMHDGVAQTASLQEQVDAALDVAGFPGEHRPFRPHVTLGRPRRRLTAAERDRWRSLAATVDLPAFRADAVWLYRSQPGPGGSRYEVLERLPLGVSAAP
jgi:RNA 2',3'-cyclic 3'-phosphodiesterase